MDYTHPTLDTFTKIIHGSKYKYGRARSTVKGMDGISKRIEATGKTQREALEKLNDKIKELEQSEIIAIPQMAKTLNEAVKAFHIRMSLESWRDATFERSDRARIKHIENAPIGKKEPLKVKLATVLQAKPYILGHINKSIKLAMGDIAPIQSHTLERERDR